MNKEIIENEVEFPDEIISFLKIKYPKAFTDQEKSVLKQIEYLTEEKKELKEMINKKRDQEKAKLMPINVAACEEAKEKAIKLVQEGTLNLTSRNKILDIDDSLFGDSDQLNLEKFKKKSKVRSHNGNKQSENNNETKQNASQKISFISAGYAFKDQPADKTDDMNDANFKRQMSLSSPFDSGPPKRLRQISDSSSGSDNEDKTSAVNNNAFHLQKSENLRFCGHNLSVEFVRKIVEPFGNIVFIEMEPRTDGMTPNVIATMDNLESAVSVRNGLDSKYVEGRVVNVHYRRDGGGFSNRRPYRRRRGRNLFRARDTFSFQRNTSFQSQETDKTLPSHFYSANVEVDDRIKRRPNWTVPDDSEHNSESSAKVNPLGDSPREDRDRGLVVYDDFPEAEEIVL